MRRWFYKRKNVGLAAGLMLAGGTVFQGNCANALYSLPICGGILTFCTPTDQLNVLFPLLTTPDFSADPSCTIPLGCGGSDIFDDFPDGFNPPGGDETPPPEDDMGGELGGTGGGGGGGV
jgi:hypothetical protein